ncbi:uncharacterized protein NFIA_113570 [Aspergillus fischeri NRRL 181]|uniref:Uncharacterized protein n=1 Tax=Neosartorya fischeri (strain ATCC 1020 / DSM 3700 / CBS 544.65 / FGSC A1164 / JCM 1740 / NRRL 181 / WB 181) TaxID=331117 RepID=A1D8W5_NEOFI|nr:uncharacterized protein NFIA_113570 [Aspergillus fischeri NRRL 181]EAW20826.1 hypothetical protein NFIA_113570 [Aspergillus fischeri NRRL 181]
MPIFPASPLQPIKNGWHIFSDLVCNKLTEGAERFLKTQLMTAMSVVERYVKFRGVLYVDSMEENRVTPATEKILTWLWLFCGQDYMPNVTVVTTRWDGLDADGIETKMARVEKWRAEGLLQRFFEHGASIYHHGLVMEGGNYKTLHIERQAERRRVLARDAITALYQHPPASSFRFIPKSRMGLPSTQLSPADG